MPNPATPLAAAPKGRAMRAARAGRRAGFATLLLLSLGLPGSGPVCADPPAPNPRPPGAVRNDAYPLAIRSRVVEALTKATANLWSLQQADGTWPPSWHAPTEVYPSGPTAMALHALLEAGVKPDDPRIERGFAALRRLPHDRNYAAAATLIALHSRFSTRHGDYAEILETEDVDDPAPREALRRRENREDMKLARTCLDVVLACQGPNGAFGYLPHQAYWDMSNTQYSLLGLRAARGLGLEVKPAVWAAALQFLLDWQQADGPGSTLRTVEVDGAYSVATSE